MDAREGRQATKVLYLAHLSLMLRSSPTSILGVHLLEYSNPKNLSFGAAATIDSNSTQRGVLPTRTNGMTKGSKETLLTNLFALRSGVDLDKDTSAKPLRPSVQQELAIFL